MNNSKQVTNFSDTEKFNPETREWVKGFLAKLNSKFELRKSIWDLLNFIPESLIKYINTNFKREYFLQKVWI